jgi:hypothetical protein
MKLPEAEAYLSRCASTSLQLARSQLDTIVEKLRTANCEPLACCILYGSGRALPPLPQILGSHPMIHTAEGEFFRRAIHDALVMLEIPVRKTVERELFTRASEEFRCSPARLKSRLAAVGRGLGAPWTTDQKNSALAACIALA